MWRMKLKEGRADMGYFPSSADPALFVHVDKDGKRRYLFTHVWDILYPR